MNRFISFFPVFPRKCEKSDAATSKLARKSVIHVTQRLNIFLSWSRKAGNIALAGVTQWVEQQPANRKVASLIPSQGMCPGCGPGPTSGHARGSQSMYLSQTDVALPLFLPPFPSL